MTKLLSASTAKQLWGSALSLTELWRSWGGVPGFEFVAGEALSLEPLALCGPKSAWKHCYSITNLSPVSSCRNAEGAGVKLLHHWVWGDFSFIFLMMLLEYQCLHYSDTWAQPWKAGATGPTSQMCKCSRNHKCRVLLLFVLCTNAFLSLAGLKQLLKQGSVQKVYNGLQGYWCVEKLDLTENEKSDLFAVLSPARCRMEKREGGAIAEVYIIISL